MEIVAATEPAHESCGGILRCPEGYGGQFPVCYRHPSNEPAP